LAAAATLACVLAGGAAAQQMRHGAAAASPEVEAFQAANDRMMHDMGAPLSGNADHDFAASMVPHHQGAIDMAHAELAYGKDPELRRLAQSIIDSQSSEIGMLQRWLAQHPS